MNVPTGRPRTLDILVENDGRINFGSHLSDSLKGLTGTVTLGGLPIVTKKHGGSPPWKIYSLPMTSPAFIGFWEKDDGVYPTAGPAFHRGSFTLEKPGDTYLDTSSLKKGFVWLNGHNLGRTWDIGPQKSLFVPAPWLRAGTNEVVVFDYSDLGSISLRGVKEPVWSQGGK
jgi:beta-galactosidase